MHALTGYKSNSLYPLVSNHPERFITKILEKALKKLPAVLTRNWRDRESIEEAEERRSWLGTLRSGGQSLIPEQRIPSPWERFLQAHRNSAKPLRIHHYTLPW